ncbi:MAG: DUF3307 domain-containing protein [Bacteroidaceae bacterium]|jgi:hypothetical protein
MNSWLLLSLLTAHVIGDFYLQSSKYCKRKEESKLKSSFLYIHAILIGLLSWAFVPTVDFWLYALLIAVTHFLIDAVKSYMHKGLWQFLIDQIAHIVILCFIAHQQVLQCHLPIQSLNFHSNISIPIFMFALLCCLKPTNILIKLILERYKIGEAESCESMKNAGALIGNLERILTLVFVLIGQYEAVGFIIAAKSVLRFKDTDTAKTEYVLAGTLLSFGIATLLGLMVKQLSSVF